jgi:selenocysteine-specific elongation factor
VVTPRPERWVQAEVLDRACATLDGALAAWFAEHAHRAVVDVLELRRRTGFEAGFLAAVLDHRERAGALELLPGGRVRPVGRAAELSPALRRLADAVGERLAAARFQPPSLKELAEAGTGAPTDLERVAEHLVDDGAVAHVGGGLYVATAALAEARAAIVENRQAHGHLEIPELRDRLGTTRKFLIPLLEYFDAQGVTIRQGANRVLRK